VAASAHPHRVRKKSKPKPPKTEQPFPDDFTLTNDRRKFATDHGIANPDIEFELFRAKALEKRWTSGNWVLKWNQWVLHAKQYADERAKHNGTSRPAPPARKLPTAAEVEAARAAKREH
jgi:hypothetical protein